MKITAICSINFFFLVGYVEERPWWPIQSPNKERKKKASSKLLALGMNYDFALEYTTNCF